MIPNTPLKLGVLADDVTAANYRTFHSITESVWSNVGLVRSIGTANGHSGFPSTSSLFSLIISFRLTPSSSFIVASHTRYVLSCCPLPVAFPFSLLHSFLHRHLCPPSLFILFRCSHLRFIMSDHHPVGNHRADRGRAGREEDRGCLPEGHQARNYHGGGKIKVY